MAPVPEVGPVWPPAPPAAAPPALVPIGGPPACPAAPDPRPVVPSPASSLQAAAAAAAHARPTTKQSLKYITTPKKPGREPLAVSLPRACTWGRGANLG